MKKKWKEYEDDDDVDVDGVYFSFIVASTRQMSKYWEEKRSERVFDLIWFIHAILLFLSVIFMCLALYWALYT